MLKRNIGRHLNRGNILRAGGCLGAGGGYRVRQGADMVPMAVRGDDQLDFGRTGRIRGPLAQELRNGRKIVGSINQDLAAGFFGCQQINVVIHFGHRNGADSDCRIFMEQHAFQPTDSRPGRLRMSFWL